MGNGNVTIVIESSNGVDRDKKVCTRISDKDYMIQEFLITIPFYIWKVVKCDSPSREAEIVQDKMVIFEKMVIRVICICHYFSLLHCYERS